MKRLFISPVTIKETIMLVIMSVIFSISTDVTASTFETYTNPSDFNSSVSTNYSWDFNDVVYKPNKLIENIDGPGSVVLLKALVSTGGTIEGGPIEGNFLYLNPQSPLGAFRFNSSAVTAFGISTTWADFYNPQGIEASFYDFNDNLIGSIHLNSDDALGARYLSPEAPYRSLYYDGFLGINSSTPISRMVMSQQFAGSVFYDGLVWYDGNPNPDSDPNSGPKPPKTPTSPNSPKSPIAPKSPNSPATPTTPYIGTLFSAAIPTSPDSPFAPNSPASIVFSQEGEVQTITNPEPATLALFGSGIAGLLFRRKRAQLRK